MPQGPAAFVLPIEVSRVRLTDIVHGVRQALRGPRRQQNMGMRPHQGVVVDVDRVLATCVAQQREVLRAVLVVDEYVEVIIRAMVSVEGHVRNDDTAWAHAVR